MGALHPLAYYGLYTEGNWPGQRHRFFRNLNALQWRQLYGHSYVYSSDYIHANRHAFARSTRCLARVANLVEEAAEILQRTTTWHMRFTGSIIPSTLRDLSGKGRFCFRFKRMLENEGSGNDAAGKLAAVLTGDVLNRFYDELERQKLVNAKSQLVCNLQSTHAVEKIARSLANAGVAPDVWQCESCMACLQRCLAKADMRTLWTALSARKKAAYVAGSVWSTGTQLGINTLLALASSSFLATVVGKTLALAGGLYAASFLLRLATTCQARWMHTYRGQRSCDMRRYSSLSETLLFKTRELRNRIYGSRVRYKATAKVVVEGIHIDEREYRSANFAWHSRLEEMPDGERRFAVWAVESLQRLTDVVYAADSVSSRLVGRLIRRTYCTQSTFRQHAGETAGGQCHFAWTTRAASDSRWGHVRLQLARLLGVGGADTLGAAIGCLTVSILWTALSKTSGGLGTVVVINGAPAIVPLGSSVIGACGWSASLLMEGVLRFWRAGRERISMG